MSDFRFTESGLLRASEVATDLRALESYVPVGGPTLAVFHDCNTMTGWQQAGTDYSSNGTDIVKVALNYDGPLMLTTPASSPDMRIRATLPTAGQPGWDHFIFVRVESSLETNLTVDGYLLDLINVPAGTNLTLFRAVNGTFTSIATWPAAANATNVIALDAVTVGGNVVLEGWMYDYVLATTVSLGTYTDTHADRVLTGTYGGVGSYFPVTIAEVEIWNL